MTYTNEQELRDALLNEHRMVFFIGSGLSINFHSWEKFLIKFIQAIAEKKNMYVKKNTTPSSDIWQLMKQADDYESTFKPNDLKKYMENSFPRDPEKIPSVFDILVKIPCSFYITTNYDTNIEDSYFRAHGEELPIVYLGNTEESLHLLSENKPFLFKIHGCIKRGDNFIISDKDYLTKINNNQNLQTVLQALFECHKIVFLGYSRSDQYIKDILKKLNNELPNGPPPRYQFIKKAESENKAEEYYDKFGIRLIEINDWPDLEDFFGQILFLQIRNKYTQIRLKYWKSFKMFIDKRHGGSLWGALLYGFSSVDIGRISDCQLLIDTVTKDKVLRDAIGKSVATKLLFYIIAGQMHKRQCFTDKARKDFEVVEKIANSNSNIITPIRSLGLRYAGIFWCQNSSGKDDAFERSQRLLNSAKEILGDGFPEESLDAEKWLAVHSAEKNLEEAISKLKEIADKAEKIRYTKNAAWCWIAAAQQSVKLDSGNIKEIMELIDKAKDAFEYLDHFCGLSECYYYEALMKQKTGTKKETVKQMIDMARAYAVIVCDERRIQRCADFCAKNGI